LGHARLQQTNYAGAALNREAVEQISRHCDAGFCGQDAPGNRTPGEGVRAKSPCKDASHNDTGSRRRCWAAYRINREAMWLTGVIIRVRTIQTTDTHSNNTLPTKKNTNGTPTGGNLRMMKK